MAKKNPLRVSAAEVRAVLNMKDDRQRFHAGFMQLSELSGGVISQPRVSSRRFDESPEERNKREDERHRHEVATLEAHLAIVTADEQ